MGIERDTGVRQVGGFREMMFVARQSVMVEGRLQGITMWHESI